MGLLEIVQEPINDKEKINLLKSFCDEKLGKGKAVQNGLLRSTKNYVGFMDADMSAPPKEFLRCIKYITEYDIVIGSRIIRGNLGEIERPFSRTLFSRFYSILFQILFNIPIKDTQCGFKLYKKQVAKLIFSKLSRFGFDHDLEIVLLLKSKHIRIKELPVKWIHKNNSSLNIFWDPIKMFLGIFLLKFRNF
mgnify:CR=1 FL=1